MKQYPTIEQMCSDAHSITLKLEHSLNKCVLVTRSSKCDSVEHKISLSERVSKMYLSLFLILLIFKCKMETTLWTASLEFNGPGLDSMSPDISNNEVSTYTKCKLALLHMNTNYDILTACLKS